MKKRLSLLLSVLLLLSLTVPLASAAESRAYNSVSVIQVDGKKLYRYDDWMIELVAGVEKEIVIEMDKASEPGVLAKPQSSSNPFKSWFTVVSQPKYVNGKGTLVVKATAYDEASPNQSIFLNGDTGNSYSRAMHFSVIPGLSKFAPSVKACDLNVGNTRSFGLTIQPASRADTAVTYKSSNAKVATVDKNGLIKGIAAGKATITATSEKDKKTASMEVTVRASNASLGAVTGAQLTARKSDWNQASLSWNAVKDATGYRIYCQTTNLRNTGSKSDWELVGDVKKTSKLLSIVPKEITSADTPYQYLFRVVAYNDKGEAKFPAKDTARMLVTHLYPSMEGKDLVAVSGNTTTIKLKPAGLKNEKTVRYTSTNAAAATVKYTAVANNATYKMPGNANAQEYVTFVSTGGDPSDGVPAMDVLHFGSYKAAKVTNAAFWNTYTPSGTFLRTELKFSKYKGWDSILECVGTKNVYLSTFGGTTIGLTLGAGETLKYVQVTPYTRVQGRPLYGTAVKAIKGS